MSLSGCSGAQTFAEEHHVACEKLRDTIASEPLVAQILDIFPGASIDEIKNPESTDAAVRLIDDNGFLPAGQNNNDDEEEMSG